MLALAGAGGESVIRVGDGAAAGGSMIATIAAELTGGSRLVKTDPGTLVLEGVNSYTGGTRIDAGVLSVSADAGLGAASGGLVLNGGTLATTADILTTRGVTFEGAGKLEVAAGTTLELRGAIGGRDLRKTGAGTLVLAGASSYRNTEVEAGTLIGDADTIRGSLSNAGTVVFDQSVDGSFAGAIRGLDVAVGTMVKRGDGSLALTGTSELDWTLEAGDLLIGSARFSGNVAIGSNADQMVDLSASAGINVGRISGTGALLKTGYSTFVYNVDGSGFTGLTTINRGGFVVGQDELHADATLGGSYGFGSWGSFAGTDNATSVNNDVGGIFMGADAPVLESWRLGVMAGYSSTSFDIDDRSSSGDGTDWHVGLYGGTQQGPVGVRLGLAYTWSEIETARAVAIPGFSDQLKGDYDAGTFQAFGDVGYRIDLGGASFEPFAGLAYVSVDTDGFTEQGGAAALSAAGQDMETTFTTLGLRASTCFALTIRDPCDVVPSIELGGSDGR